jgi:hypothetical protein
LEHWGGPPGIVQRGIAYQAGRVHASTLPPCDTNAELNERVTVECMDQLEILAAEIINRFKSNHNTNSQGARS